LLINTKPYNDAETSLEEVKYIIVSSILPTMKALAWLLACLATISYAFRFAALVEEVVE
jgi:hypothetical protein